MNSRLYPTLFLTLLFFSSCGLKKSPIVPGGNSLPSISDRYKVIYSNPTTTKTEEEKNKKSKTKN